jgi:hypothetical protein
LRKHPDIVDVAMRKKKRRSNESQPRKKKSAVGVARKKKRKPLNESDLSPMKDAQPRKKSKRPRGSDRQQPVQTNHTVTAVGGIIPRPPRIQRNTVDFALVHSLSDVNGPAPLQDVLAITASGFNVPIASVISTTPVEWGFTMSLVNCNRFMVVHPKVRAPNTIKYVY